ncbi:MAG: hypothetical protein KDD62_02695 [Bdellovibrionales bacterium]|nr:hypothetical protein [Bdellovibrionales bacterium]
MTHTQSQSVRQRQRLELNQKVSCDQQLSLRATLLQALHPDGYYHPEGRCPQCEHDLSIKEVLQGFSRDPNDFLTTCPKCKARFAPKMTQRSNASSTELPFYCEVQTIGWLRRIDPIGYDEFKKQYPAVLQSARYYFGTLTNAFSQIGIDYLHEPELKWHEKVKPFLGMLPDSVIAECVGKAASTIRRLRIKEGVEKYAQKSRKQSKSPIVSYKKPPRLYAH